MNKRTALLTFMLVLSGSASGGGNPELIFKSGFEGKEACVILDGLGDFISIPVITITGDFLLNGGAFPANEFDDGVIYLRHRETGDIIPLGETKELSYSINIVPGRYDVLYTVQSPGANVPHNVDAVVMENVALTISGTFDIEITSYLIGGDMLLNGGEFPAVEYDDGVLYLHSELLGTVRLGDSKDRDYGNVPVLPGEYEVRFQVQSPGDTVPHNTWGRSGLVSVSGDNANLDVNVTTIALGGSFSQNGVLMPAAENNDGNFYLETDAGDRVLLGNSHDQTYTRNVIPGKYHVYWELESQGGGMPFNPRARISSNVDINSGTLNINMLSHTISGDYLQNGAPFTNDVAHTARIMLKDLVDGQETEIGFTHEGSYSHRLVDASYDVIYRYIQGTTIPGNLAAVIDRFNVKNNAVLDVAVVAANFGAQVNLDGALFPADNAQLAYISLRNPNDPADGVFVGITPQQTLAARALVGTYDVYYLYQGGDQIPVNKNALIYSGATVNLLMPWPPINGGLQLEVQSRILNGQFLRNNALAPGFEYDDGWVDMSLGGESLRFGNTHDQSYSVRVIKPEENVIYPLHYEAESRGDTMPENGDVPFGCFLYEPVPL